MKFLITRFIYLCTDYGKEWCIDYDFKKTKVMTFGKRKDTSLTIRNQSLAILDSWKHIGEAAMTGRKDTLVLILG